MKRNTNRITTGLTLFLATFLAGGQAVADVDLAQAPLFLGKSVAPNIMFMIDDSGSMQFEALPGDIVNDFGDTTRYMYEPVSDVYKTYTYWDSYSERPGTDEDDDEAAFYRSVHNNKLYYNPGVDYEPWSKADGTKMADADPAAAYHNPGNKSAGTRDLTAKGNCSSGNSYTVSPGGPYFKLRYYSFYGKRSNYTLKDYMGNEYAYVSGSWYQVEDDYYKKDCDDYFYPATYFEYDGSGDVKDADNYTRVKIKSGNGPFPSGRSYSEEIQNFANWYTYYRSRTLAARAGIGQAFSEQGENIRVGYGSINDRGNLDGVRDFKGSDREDFFDSLYNDEVPREGTPLRKGLKALGQYYSDDDQEGPWSSKPGESDGDIYSCRGSYSVLMTDGYYSGGDPFFNQNVDGTDGNEITNPKTSGDNYTYEPEYPFEDGRDDTLADVAMKYWKQDLVSDTKAENRVSPTQLDPAFWQHMVTYGVGFGVSGDVDPDKAFNHITQDSVPAANQISWPNPYTSDNAKIDDLLHASVNGRGGYFSATDPDVFAQEMSSLIESLVERSSGSGSSVAANSTRLGTETRIYQARFDSANWTGDVRAYSLDDDGNIDVTAWSAADQLDNRDLSAEPRTLATWDPNAGEGAPFSWSNLTSDQKDALKDGEGAGVGEARLEYLRGQQDDEQANGGNFRNRDSRMGDVINSEPVYTYDESYGFAGAITDGQQAYQPFIRSLDDGGRPPMVYVGGNDGMLHGFNAKTGKEVFSFVPDSVMDDLADLTEPGYSHQFFVDGSPKVGDVYMDKNGDGNKTWHRILVGTLGNGGEAVFALDITDPANFDPQTDVLWEFTHEELGAGVTQANIVRVSTDASAAPADTEHRWDVVLANGYNSDSDGSSLLVLDPKTGNLRQRVEAGEGDNADPNGLATPFVADDDRDRTAELAYAGDLKGNLWKFRVEADGDWKLDGGLSPDAGLLFKAEDDGGDAQPITSQVSVGLNDQGEKVVVFGTGRLLESNDGLNKQPQDLYGIIDTGASVDRSNLLEQTFEKTVDEPGGTFRLVSDNELADPPQPGWHVSLDEADGADEGERSVVQPTVRDGKVIFVSAVPSTTVCDPGGSSWLTVVDLADGSRPAGSFFDVAGDGGVGEEDLIDSNNVAPTSAKSDLGNVAQPSIIRGDKKDKAVLSGLGTEDDTSGECEGDCETRTIESSSSTGTRAWRQVR